MLLMDPSTSCGIVERLSMLKPVSRWHLTSGFDQLGLMLPITEVRSGAYYLRTTASRLQVRVSLECNDAAAPRLGGWWGGVALHVRMEHAGRGVARIARPSSLKALGRIGCGACTELLASFQRGPRTRWAALQLCS